MAFEIENGVLKKYTEEPGVTEVEIPEGVTKIGKQAFENCKRITSIAMPVGVLSIGSYAFNRCKRLTSIVISESVIHIGNHAFQGCDSLTNITIPNGVTKIGECAFYSCKNLANITIPKSITSIEEDAFCGCQSLTDINIPESVTKIANYTFRDCVRLKSIAIPKSLTSIGWGAFEGCQSLTDITIPESVKNIGYMAFYGCKNLKIYFLQFHFYWDCSKIPFDNDGYDMLREKDFYRKSHDRNYHSKLPLILDFYAQTSDADAAAYIKENGPKFVQYVTDTKTFVKLLSDKLLSTISLYKVLISSCDNNGDIFQSIVMEDKNENATAMLKKNCKVLLKHIIDVQNMDALDHLLDLGCVTKKNIDEFIKYAIDNQKYEPQIVLTHYKADHFGFANLEVDFDKEFSLD